MLENIIFLIFFVQTEEQIFLQFKISNEPLNLPIYCEIKLQKKSKVAEALLMQLYKFEQTEEEPTQIIYRQFKLQKKRKRSKLGRRNQFLGQGMLVKNYLFKGQHEIFFQCEQNQCEKQQTPAKQKLQYPVKPSMKQLMSNQFSQRKSSREEQDRTVLFNSQKLQLFDFQQKLSKNKLNSEHFCPQFKRCTLVRNRSGLKFLRPEFYLYDQNTGALILTTKRKLTFAVEYAFYQNQQIELGCLVGESNYVYNLSYQEQSLQVVYDQKVGSKSPRKLAAYVKNGCKTAVVRNCPPKWNPDSNRYTLDLGGRAKLSSVKNMVMVEQETGQQLLILSKFQQNQFHLDFKFPLTQICAVGIALTAFSYVHL